MKVGIICTSFHKEEMDMMLHHASEELISNGLELAVIEWVPGVMEIPLTVNRILKKNNLKGIVTLGIIEEGKTQHGAVIGQAVINSIINYYKPALEIRGNLQSGRKTFEQRCAACHRSTLCPYYFLRAWMVLSWREIENHLCSYYYFMIME